MFGDSGPWGIFESMIPGSKIHGTIIDIWDTILNHLELRRNKKSPARMFLSCTLLVKLHLGCILTLNDSIIYTF